MLSAGSSRLPWHELAWGRLKTAEQAGRLPHGLIISGRLGDGLAQFCEHLVAAWLCRATDPAARPCTICTDCRLLMAGSHPDVQRLEPEEGTARVGVDATRQVIEFAGLSASQGRGKWIYIPAADELNVQSSNCLLKTLEEPPGNTIFLLQVEHRARLLATIRSRCQTLHLGQPSEAEGLAWLQGQGVAPAEAGMRLELAAGAPLAALALDPTSLGALRVRVVEALHGLATRDGEVLALSELVGACDLLTALRLLTSLAEDVLRLATGAGSARLRHPSLSERLRGVATHLGALAASRWVAACYASLRRSLATGLKPEELLDALALELAGSAGGPMQGFGGTR